MKTKKDKEYSFNHFKDRLKERFILDITKEEYNKLCFDVKEKFKTISIEEQKKDTQIIYIGEWKNIQLKVVWSENRQCLTTVLPRKDNL